MVLLECEKRSFYSFNNGAKCTTCSFELMLLHVWPSKVLVLCPQSLNCSSIVYLLSLFSIWFFPDLLFVVLEKKHMDMYSRLNTFQQYHLKVNVKTLYSKLTRLLAS